MNARVSAATKSTRTASQTAHAHLGQMVDGLALAAYATDADGFVTYFNDAAVALTGRVPQLGSDRWCVTSKALRADGSHLPHDECPMAAALRDEPFTTAVECIGERPDGSRFWFAPYPTVLRDENGRVTGGLNILVDITARKNAQTRSEALFQAMFDATPDCVMLVRRSGRLLQINNAGLATLEATQLEDAIGRDFQELVAPECRESFGQFHASVCAGERKSHEFDIIGLMGTRRCIESYSVPLKDVHGEAAHLAVARDISERKATERAALLLRAIVDSSDDAIISKDLNGVITSWNKSAERVFGYTAEEAVGKPVTMLIPPDRQQEEPMILSRLRSGERVDHFETIRRRKDGRLIDISLTISPVRDATGRIIGASKIARDVSESKRGERARRLLSAIVDSSDDAIISKDLNGIITSWNKGAEQLFGYSAAETIGKPITILMPPDRVNEEPGILARIRRGEKVDHFETVRQRKDGTLLDISLTISPVKDASGKIVGASKIARNITEQKRVQAALMESEGRFRQLANSMPQIVWTAGPDGHLDYFNERWYEFSGSSEDESANGDFVRLLRSEDASRWEADWHAAIRDGNNFQTEYQFWDQAGQCWRWFMGRAVPIRNEASTILKWIGSWTDIDEQKRSEDELRRANQDLEQFAYSASHDLQEPLRTVQLYGEILSTRYAEALPEKAQEYMSFVRAGAARMEKLVNDLLSYTQLAKVQKSAEPVNTNEVAGIALEALAGAIEETGAQVTIETLPRVNVDSTHLQQLFQNLIGNALKYRSRERGPVIKVSATRAGDEWKFAVSDNGIGIDAQYKEKIFGLFKRLHTSDEYPGTGIGLAICQRIIERYHGRIWVESRLGEGSTFYFTLPA